MTTTTTNVFAADNFKGSTVARCLLDDAEHDLRRDRDSLPGQKARTQAAIAQGYALVSIAEALEKLTTK